MSARLQRETGSRGRSRRGPDTIPLTVWAILLSQFVMNAATFMVTPFLVLYLSRSLRLDPAEVGTTLAVYLGTLRFVPLATGVLADQVGFRFGLISGIVLRAIGLAGFAFVASWPGILVPAFLVGLGGALYDPAGRSAIAAQRPALLPRIFGLRNQLLNAGALIGPATGALMAGLGPKLPFVSAAGCLAVLSAVLWPARVETVAGPARSSWISQLRRGLGDSALRWLWPIMAVSRFLFVQLQVSFPVRTLLLGNGEIWTTAIFITNGVVGIVTMFVLQRPLRQGGATSLVAIGFASMAIAFVLVPLMPSGWWLLLCVTVYSVGETMLLPSFDVLLAGVAGSGVRGTYFGLSATAWAVGSTGGAYLGTWLVLQPGGLAPWLSYAAAALLAAAGALAFHRNEGWRRASLQAS